MRIQDTPTPQLAHETLPISKELVSSFSSLGEQANGSMFDASKLCHSFGAWATAELYSAGVSKSAIAKLVRSGTLHRARLGKYVEAKTPEHLVRAARVGGQLTGIAALQLYGCWTLQSDRYQIRVPHHELSPAIENERIVSDARSSSWPPIQGVEDCIARASREPFEQALVTIDSALHLQLVSPYELASILERTHRGRRMLAAVNGAAESGLETLVRYRLHSRGIKVRPQVKIDGVGRVDLLVGDRLVIECDGAEFHNSAVSRESDYRRDEALYARGYIPIRLSYAEIVHKWDEVRCGLAQLIASDRHRGRPNIRV